VVISPTFERKLEDARPGFFLQGFRFALRIMNFKDCCLVFELVAADWINFIVSFLGVTQSLSLMYNLLPFVVCSI
jgi:hypothetical protein